MSRPPIIPPDEKTKLILELLSGEISVYEAAQRAKVSEQAIRNWRKQFIEGGARNMRGEAVCGHLIKEKALTAEISDLKAAIGELYLQLKARRERAGHDPALRRLNGVGR